MKQHRVEASPGKGNSLTPKELPRSLQRVIKNTKLYALSLLTLAGVSSATLSSCAKDTMTPPITTMPPKPEPPKTPNMVEGLTAQVIEDIKAQFPEERIVVGLSREQLVFSFEVNLPVLKDALGNQILPVINLMPSASGIVSVENKGNGTFVIHCNKAGTLNPVIKYTSSNAEGQVGETQEIETERVVTIDYPNQQEIQEHLDSMKFYYDAKENQNNQEILIPIDGMEKEHGELVLKAFEPNWLRPTIEESIVTIDGKRFASVKMGSLPFPAGSLAIRLRFRDLYDAGGDFIDFPLASGVHLDFQNQKEAIIREALEVFRDTALKVEGSDNLIPAIIQKVGGGRRPNHNAGIVPEDVRVFIESQGANPDIEEAMRQKIPNFFEEVRESLEIAGSGVNFRVVQRKEDATLTVRLKEGEADFLNGNVAGSIGWAIPDSQGITKAGIDLYDINSYAIDAVGIPYNTFCHEMISYLGFLGEKSFPHSHTSEGSNGYLLKYNEIALSVLYWTHDPENTIRNGDSPEVAMEKARNIMPQVIERYAQRAKEEEGISR